MENLEYQANQTKYNNAPQHNRFTFQQPGEPSITFNSCFDSGNMNKVARCAYDQYHLWTASDAQGTDNQGYPKSWFYFEAAGFANRKVTFSIFRVHFLFSLSKKHNIYRPVYRIKYQSNEKSQWLRLPYPIIGLNLNSEQQLVLKFDFLFADDYKSVQFAYIYPYSYEECMKDLSALKNSYQNDKTVFLQQYQLTKSYQKRAIDFLLISSHEGKEGIESIKLTSGQTLKITKFRSNKPIIFISARVHPIQTPSSYCMNGIIKFLLNKEDMRAHLLRKYFVFLLVPMLNPDGVSRGHCRMDILNQNLNRYYSQPDQHRQPSNFAVRKLCEHFSQQKRLFMYLDLHAHPALKGNFIFGNAIYQFIGQVQSQLFPKILSQNCINFEFQQCNFSRKHMKAKDRNENETKEGCARVVLYKQFGLVHSYTMQCGYHINTFNNVLQAQNNTGNKFQVKYKLNQKAQKIYQNNQKLLEEEKCKKKMNSPQKLGLFDIFEHTSDPIDDFQSQYYKRELPLYTIDTFHNLGRNILITILDIWNKNPYSRTSDVGVYRKQIAQKQAKLDRFRKEQAGIKTKQKRIVQLIEEQLYGEWHKRNVFNYIIVNKNQKKRSAQTQKKIQTCKAIQYKNENKNPILSENNVVCQDQQDLEDSAPVISNPKQNLKEIQNKICHDHSLQSKAYVKTVKLSKINFTSNMNSSMERQKERQTVKCLLLNRQSIGPPLKISLEPEQSKGSKPERNTLTSKVPRQPSLHPGNLRIRNMFVAINGYPPSVPIKK